MKKAWVGAIVVVTLLVAVLAGIYVPRSGQAVQPDKAARPLAIALWTAEVGENDGIDLDSLMKVAPLAELGSKADATPPTGKGAVDLFISRAKQPNGMWALMTLKVAQLAPAPPEQWEKTDEQSLKTILVQSRKKSRPQEVGQRIAIFNLDNRQTPVFLIDESQALPLVYAFRTPGGAIGMLRVVKLTKADDSAPAQATIEVKALRPVDQGK